MNLFFTKFTSSVYYAYAVTMVYACVFVFYLLGMRISPVIYVTPDKVQHFSVFIVIITMLFSMFLVGISTIMFELRKQLYKGSLLLVFVVIFSLVYLFNIGLWAVPLIYILFMLTIYSHSSFSTK